MIFNIYMKLRPIIKAVYITLVAIAAILLFPIELIKQAGPKGKIYQFTTYSAIIAGNCIFPVFRIITTTFVGSLFIWGVTEMVIYMYKYEKEVREKGAKKTNDAYNYIVNNRMRN